VIPEGRNNPLPGSQQCAGLLEGCSSAAQVLLEGCSSAARTQSVTDLADVGIHQQQLWRLRTIIIWRCLQQRQQQVQQNTAIISGSS